MARGYSVRVLVGIVALAAFTLATGEMLGYRSPPFVAVEVAAIAAMLVADRVVSPKADKWARGAAGERAVGAALRPLEAEGWHVLHDVMLSSCGNIDHVVLGPGGLFTVETKSHPGVRRVDRLDRKMLRQAYAQAKALERVTREEVTPLLVFSRAYLNPAVSRRRGVVVLPARMLAGHLRRQRAVLDSGRVEALHAALTAAIS